MVLTNVLEYLFITLNCKDVEMKTNGLCNFAQDSVSRVRPSFQTQIVLFQQLCSCSFQIDIMWRCHLPCFTNSLFLRTLWHFNIDKPAVCLEIVILSLGNYHLYLILPAHCRNTELLYIVLRNGQFSAILKMKSNFS